MSFSTSICLTDIGVLPPGCVLNIYSNSDNYSDSFQDNISLSQLTTNCPYILTHIPDGTTIIKFEDIVSHCCYFLEITPNNLCELFGISFDLFSAVTVSQIIVGNLISSVGTITDYLINWYGPDDNTLVAFTSGYGTSFGSYQQTHPFTRVSLPGYYVPMIQKIKIDGINYSLTGGEGFIQANINCLENQTVEVFPSTCVGNRVEPTYYYPYYNNYYFCNGAAYNAPPESLSMGFNLDVNSNYFAWQFRTDVVSDTIKMTFYGDNYSEPIILEYYTIGDEYTNINVSVIPKTVKVSAGGFFKKVTNISEFLRSENDYLTIEIIPNPTISRTNWEIYFKCLTTFNCETCIDSLSPYKFISSTFNIDYLPCNLYKLTSQLSGCTNDVLYSSDVYKYLIDSSRIEGSLNSEFYGQCSSPSGEISFQSSISTGSTFCSFYTVCSENNLSCSPQPYQCDSNSGNLIKFKKTNATVGGPGNIYMEFQNLSDLELYYQSYLNNVVAYGLGTPLDNTNIDYYRYFSIVVPLIPPTDPDRTCAADVGNTVQYGIHTSSVVTTGVTDNFYFLNITMPLITLGINFNSCELNCLSSAADIVNILNNQSTGISNQFDFYSNIGAKKLNPISGYAKLVKTLGGVSQYTQTAFIRLTDLVNNTTPMSGDSYTIIPSLSAETCDLSGYLDGGTYLGVTRYYKNAWRYITTVTLLNTYDIYTTNLSGYSVLIYSYDLNTNTLIYQDLSYFI